MAEPIIQELERIATGYRASQALFAAVRLGVFEALAAKPLSAVALARRLQSDPRATRMLANALAGLGILRKRGQRFENGALARRYLLPNAELSQHALTLHNAELYERWAELPQVVRTGKPRPRKRSPRKRQHAFARAMASSGIVTARETAAAVQLDNPRTMLDIGGGPGVYAIEFVRRHPGLRAEVMDAPAALEIARENIARAGLAERIRTRSGDAFRDPLGRGYDLVLLSNVIHIYSAAENRRLIARAARALAPAGRLAIKDFVLDDQRTGPETASLFALNMLLNTAAGDCYTAPEIEAWMRRAGLARCHRVGLTGGSALVIGEAGKPTTMNAPFRRCSSDG